jgi:hypothetical protein
MSYNIGAKAIIRRTKQKDIEKSIEKVSDVLGDGTRIDRYIQIYSDGSFDLTTHNVNAVQSKPLPVMDEFDFCSLHLSVSFDEYVFHIIADAIVEAIEKANCPLLDSKNNEFIRKAKPKELMDFWLEAPKGYIYVWLTKPFLLSKSDKDIFWGQTEYIITKKCYVQI